MLETVLSHLKTSIYSAQSGTKVASFWLAATSRTRVPTWLTFPSEQVKMHHYLSELLDRNSKSFGVLCDLLLFDVLSNYPFLFVSLFSGAKLLWTHNMNWWLSKWFAVPWRWRENWGKQLSNCKIDFKLSSLSSSISNRIMLWFKTTKMKCFVVSLSIQQKFCGEFRNV